MVTEASQENVAPLVPQEKVASVESLDSQVVMVPQVLLGLQGRKDILDPPAS